MAELLAVFSKLIDRPSTVWRLAWLLFCLVIICFGGSRTLRKVTPQVLAGITLDSSPAKNQSVLTMPQEEDGKFATWILPLIAWAILVGILVVTTLR